MNHTQGFIQMFKQRFKLKSMIGKMVSRNYMLSFCPSLRSVELPCKFISFCWRKHARLFDNELSVIKNLQVRCAQDYIFVNRISTEAWESLVNGTASCSQKVAC
uniref:Uncharacterized protein n=1 Tax=Rhizophora mucronata TaxID=61149 RepID=A0A2P2PNI4_RHIMU